ncbi:STAS domain-containing protein [Streptomyces sp. NPDC057250]|uniref:STAS domain-containing protein n=1 Tax=unclassified Streptomyces TaxID=2593676 RepID=UPI003630B52D
MTRGETSGTGHAGQPGRLSAATTDIEGVRVVALSGEIDHTTGDTLRQALAVPDTPGPRVVADMREVTFMDSSGINVLITAHHALTEADGWLRLSGTTDPVLRTIGLVGLDTVIGCHETLAQALDA